MPAPPLPARALGYAGLIPFAALAGLDLAGVGGAAVLTALVGYGAVILAFMGGCRWGFAAAGLGEGPDWAPLAVSVLPALWAWPVAMLAPPAWAAVLLALGFAALYLADRTLTAAGGAPPW